MCFFGRSPAASVKLAARKPFHSSEGRRGKRGGKCRDTLAEASFPFILLENREVGGDESVTAECLCRSIWSVVLVSNFHAKAFFLR